MSDVANRDVQQAAATLESLDQTIEAMIAETISLEGIDESDIYVRHRELQAIEQSLGMEAVSFQDVKDVFAAAGRLAASTGRGFMTFLDAVHRTIDTTHLVRTQQLRAKYKALSAEDGMVDKGRMERPKIANGLAIGGEVPKVLHGPTQQLLDFSKRTASNVLPTLSSLNRQVGARLNSKRWMGNAAFAAEVDELAKIIGGFKTPIEFYPHADYQRMYPGDRTIFTSIKPKRPRRQPNLGGNAVRRVLDGVTNTNVGLRGNADHIRGKADPILRILNAEEALSLLADAEALLQEAKRIKQVAKSFGKDRVPGTMSLMLSGFLHGVKKQVDDIWTAQDDGFDVIEGTHQGGQTVRHKPGTRNMMGGLVSKMSPGVGFEARKDDPIDDEEKMVLAAWVARYLKLSLIDQQKTSQALIMLLVGVARTYLDYVEASYDYYT